MLDVSDDSETNFAVETMTEQFGPVLNRKAPPRRLHRIPPSQL